MKIYFVTDVSNDIVEAKLEEILNYDSHCNIIEYDLGYDLEFKNEQEKQDFLRKFLNVSLTHLEYVS